MAKKGGGKGSFWDNPFGGIFDFNHDNKEDFGEQWLAFKIFEECTKEKPHDYSSEYIHHSISDDDNDSIDNSWRDFCEDGSEFDIDPEDYETEDDYTEALEEAQNGDFSCATPSISFSISMECPALDKLDEIKEDNYPNKRRFNAAYTLANEFICYSDKEAEQKDKACCQFIIDNADKITAANYLSYDCGFLYAQAIKDNFKLPVSLPDEDEYREYELSETLCKIAKRNIALSFEVWEWALTTFLPYIHYANGSLSELTSSVIDELYSFPKGYKTELSRYIDRHPAFMEKVVDEKAEMASNLDALIVAALQDGLMDTALALFKRGLVQAGNDWKKINGLVNGTIYLSKNYDELESAEYFKLNMLPLIKAIDIGMVRDEIDEWEINLDEYISHVENNCEQYAYTRKNTWRKAVPDGTKYGLDPRHYDSEQEYIEALNEKMYGWREWYKDEDTLGLNVNDFENPEKYQKAYNVRLNEKRQRELEQQEQERQQLRQQREKEQREQLEKEQRIEAEKARVDDKIYTLCGVTFPYALHPYHYRTDDPTIKVGDEVLVPVGNKETIGTVISVGQYMRIAAPFPIDKTKFIIRKIDEKLE